MDRCEALQYEIAILEQSIEDAKNFKHTAYDDIPELIVLSQPEKKLAARLVLKRILVHHWCLKMGLV